MAETSGIVVTTAERPELPDLGYIIGAAIVASVTAWAWIKILKHEGLME